MQWELILEWNMGAIPKGIKCLMNAMEMEHVYKMKIMQTTRCRENDGRWRYIEGGQSDTQ